MTTGAPTPTARGRSRARTLIPLSIAAWLVLEIWLLTLVAGAAGGFTVFALLVAGIVLGAVVIKRAGRRAFANLTETLQRQAPDRTPGADPFGTGPAGASAAPSSRGEGNGLLMLGGLLLMLPGLVSDLFGLLLLLPPVRTRLARSAERSLERRMNAVSAETLGGAFQQARMRRPDGKVVQGEVIVRDEPPADETPRPPLTP
ncbi:FxsA family membrane protein [Streptomyces genisteinicus]|uniref:FxsA family protein n=1 Tax=Streptomyces genisteinicus TaxID=2768068 RepID=A0A7H0HNZ3_9ACTN|nr:FxsA family membrane protein [Streptomyces genisteinicus]QNP62259.1 FxsA family protein [Streptomyces genisteinicus]